ncbi:MAG TPA: hypothetical protein PLS66_06175 [Tepiditoga sp.]|nr:hypothetical protein [Tepiditoga sp.]
MARLLTENISNKGHSQKNERIKPGKVYFEMFFGTLNIFFSVLIFLGSFFVIMFKDIIKSALGNQFELNMIPLIYITVPIFIFGILLHIYSLEKISERGYKIVSLGIFFLGIVMTGLIGFMIIKYSLNWFGVTLFGKTDIGLNGIFYIPSIIYLLYSIFIVWYSIMLMRK